VLVSSTVVGLVLLPTAAHAYSFDKTLRSGDTGRDVKALQMRVAGWYSARKAHFPIDGEYGPSTTAAVQAFEAFFDLPVDGVADEDVFTVLDSLTDKDGSTEHFDFSEFTQNRSSSCSARANAYAGTLDGGMVSPKRALRNVKRLMWRLEAVRAKAGNEPVAINSGFRSVAYNDCIGGARSSQHMYGTAADNRIAERTNRRARRVARHSQIHGIGCYSKLSHNHFDLRIDNADLPSSRFWWWPDRDAAGRELDEAGVPCWGERPRTPPTGPAAVFAAVLRAVPGAGSLIPSAAEIEAFGSAGEPSDLDKVD
jgi:zinc D-Ala-D-Ala carboxypeptidase